METGSLELPRCRVCGVHVMPQQAVAFQAGGRVLFVTCRPHSRVVGESMQLVQRVAARGLREFLEDRAPNLFGMVLEVVEERRRLREQNG